MASILKIGDKWRALVRKAGHKAKCKTFKTKAAAEAWARGIEADIDRGLAVPLSTRVTVAEVIGAYRELRERTRPISDSGNEHYMLKALDRGLGEKIAAAVTPDDLVTFALMRKEEGAGPYTINMDLSKLGTVYRYGAAALKIALPDVVGSARPTLAYLRLIGGGDKRERRPTGDEFARIVAYFKANHKPHFAAAVEFAAITAMRRGEVCAIKWTDIRDGKIIEVMRKHPRKGKVLERVPLLGRAWDIVQAQEKTADDRIFPIHPQTISKYFTEACKALSIVDLHLHDMRHEGTSALFELGYTIEQVALVTGHKDWRNLRRYTQLKPEDLHRRGTRQDASPHPENPPSASPDRGK
jgi:integrase